MFLKDSGGPENDLEMVSSSVNEKNGLRLGRCSTVAVVWHRLAVEEAEVGLVAVDVLAVRQ